MSNGVMSDLHNSMKELKTNKVNNMDPATFKIIITIQKKEMKVTIEEKKIRTALETKRHNQEWASFFVEAKKSSRKRKIIMAAKRDENNIEEREIQQWLGLYYKRHDLDNDNREITSAKVPYGHGDA